MSLPTLSLFPYLKSAAPHSSAGAGDAPVLRDLGNGLLVAYAIDRGGTLEDVRAAQLAEAGIDADQLHRLSLQNLDALAAKSTSVLPHPEGEVYLVILNQNLEASLLLLDRLWDETFRHLVEGPFVAAVPARDVLAFSGADSARGLEELRTIVARLESIGPDHPVSSRLYVRSGTTWQVHL